MARKKKKVEADVVVSGTGGNQFMFCPATEAAKAWVNEHVQLEGWQWLGNAFAVDHRYAGELVEAMQEAGLVVE